MAYENQSSGSGYGAIPQGGMPEYTEAWALIEAARRMAEATLAENPKIAMREALRLNWRLWTIFQAELTAGTSNVPEDIRISMLTLCKYIDQHTVDAIPFPTEEKIRVLVEINRNIANGLLNGLNKAILEAEKKSGNEAKVEEAPAPDLPPISIDEQA
jgi:flagellar protein FlaF